MWFVFVGIVLLACHAFDVGPMAAWTFTIGGDLWKFVLPFLLAVAWWIWSDASGLTKRRAMRRDDERKRDRQARNIEAMGLGHLHDPKRKR